MADLDEVRREISAIDAQIAPLLARRLRLADDVAAAKKTMGKAIDDPVRERAVLDSVGAGFEPAVAEGVRSVYAAVFAASKAIQRRSDVTSCSGACSRP